MTKTKKVVLISITIFVVIYGLGISAVVYTFEERKRNHSKVEQFTIDNPTDSSFLVIFGDDSLLIEPYMYVYNYPVQRNENLRIRISDKKFRIIFDTTLSVKRDMTFNPTRSSYIEWHIDYYLLDDKFDLINDSNRWLNNKVKHRELIFAEQIPYLYINNREVPAFGAGTMPYLFREKDFEINYANLTNTPLSTDEIHDIEVYNAFVNYYNYLVDQKDGGRSHSYNLKLMKMQEAYRLNNYLKDLDDYITSKDYEAAQKHIHRYELIPYDDELAKIIDEVMKDYVPVEKTKKKKLSFSPVNEVSYSERFSGIFHDTFEVVMTGRQRYDEKTDSFVRVGEFNGVAGDSMVDVVKK